MLIGMCVAYVYSSIPDTDFRVFYRGFPTSLHMYFLPSSFLASFGAGNLYFNKEARDFMQEKVSFMGIMQSIVTRQTQL